MKQNLVLALDADPALVAALATDRFDSRWRYHLNQRP